MVPLFLLGLAHAGELHLCAHEDVYKCEEACEAGHVLSCSRYAQQLQHGIYDRLEKDLEAARATFRKACDLGWAPACNRLGRMMDEGEGGPVDRKGANTLYDKACDMGNSSACWNRGVDYDDTGDLATAKKYWEKACALGATDACLELGGMYEVGDGVQQSWDKAMDHFSRAFFAPTEAKGSSKAAPVGCPEGTRTFRQEAIYGWEIEVFCGKPGARRPVKHGPWIAWATPEDEAEGLPHGVITERGQYADNARTGHWVYFDERGRKKKEGDWVDGKEHGPWKRYDPETGQLLETIPYENGKRTGAVEEATYDGGKRVGAYVDGKKDGKWVDLDEEGRPKREEYYERGERVGTWTSFRAGEKTGETVYVDGEQHGLQRQFKDGRVTWQVPYVKGKRHGVEEYFAEDGKRRSFKTWKEGQLVGPFEKWSYDGKRLLEKGSYGGDEDWFVGELVVYDETTGKKAEESTFTEDGEPTGVFRMWHENGKLWSEVEYSPPGCVKTEKQWWENGKKEFESTYTDCERHGPWVAFHDNGKKAAEGVYDKGYRTGMWTEWYDNGKKRSEGVYGKEGYESGTWTRWYECGHEESEGSYGPDGSRQGTWTEWGWDEPHAKETVRYDADGYRIEE